MNEFYYKTILLVSIFNFAIPLILDQDTCLGSHQIYQPVEDTQTVYWSKLDTTTDIKIKLVNDIRIKNLTSKHFQPVPLKTVHGETKITQRSYIYYLDISSNAIESIAPHSFNIISDCLFYLIISNNRLTGLKNATFDGLSNLRELNASANFITTLETGVFSSCKSLEVLDLSRNAIKYLPPGIFLDQYFLYVLNLQGNRIEKVEIDSFKGLKHVRVLQLGENNLTEFQDDQFKYLTALKTLNISYNRLQTINGDVFISLKLLWVLILDGNSLTDLNITSITRPLVYLQKLSIGDLSWTCNNLEHDIISLQKNKVLPISIHIVNDESNINGIGCTETNKTSDFWRISKRLTTISSNIDQLLKENNKTDRILAMSNEMRIVKILLIVFISLVICNLAVYGLVILKDKWMRKSPRYIRQDDEPNNSEIGISI